MKLKSKIILLAGFVLTLAFTACTTFKADGLSYLMTNDNVQILGSFSESKTVHEVLGTPAGANLFNISSEAMSAKLTAMVKEEINKKGGNGAVNISVRYSAGFLDYLASMITWGIWAPAKLTISGDVIKTGTKTAQIETEKAIEVAVADFLN